MPAPMEPPLTARVQVIAHRGACAHLPEHTLAAYARAIRDGADFIEPDLVMTRDGVLVSRHENEISGTTDVATRGEFAARRTVKSIDGATVEGWFTEDFTLAELQTLRARERLPGLRGTAHDGLHAVASFAEIVALAAGCGRTVGLIPEIKHGSYFARLGLPMEDALLDALAAHPYTRTATVEIQSFEVGNLRYLHRERRRRGLGNVRLLQLMEMDGQPADIAAAGGTLGYAAMMAPAGLREVATYADAIGPSIRAILPLTADGRLDACTSLVRDAHAAGLEVHPYTLRPENAFLPPALREGNDPAHRAEAGSLAEMRALLAAGVDAFFTDDPALGRRAVDGDNPPPLPG